MAWARGGSSVISTRRLARVLNNMCGSNCDCSSISWLSAASRLAISAAAWAKLSFSVAMKYQVAATATMRLITIAVRLCNRSTLGRPVIASPIAVPRV